jgi:hypothetical protein
VVSISRRHTLPVDQIGARRLPVLPVGPTRTGSRPDNPLLRAVDVVTDRGEKSPSEGHVTTTDEEIEMREPALSE